MTVRARITPTTDDRLIELVAVEDAEPPVVVCRSQTDVRHDLQGRAQTATATWTLPTGTYAIVVCVTGSGRGRCAERPVVVR